MCFGALVLLRSRKPVSKERGSGILASPRTCSLSFQSCLHLRSKAEAREAVERAKLLVRCLLSDRSWLRRGQKDPGTRSKQLVDQLGGAVVESSTVQTHMLLGNGSRAKPLNAK